MQWQQLASLPSRSSPFAALLSLGGLALLPGTRCSVVVSDNPLMLLSHGLRAFLARARPVGARVARHGSYAGPVDRTMRRPCQLCAGFELRQLEVAHDLQIVDSKVIKAPRHQFGFQQPAAVAVRLLRIKRLRRV